MWSVSLCVCTKLCLSLIVNRLCYIRGWTSVLEQLSSSNVLYVRMFVECWAYDLLFLFSVLICYLVAFVILFHDLSLLAALLLVGSLSSSSCMRVSNETASSSAECSRDKPPFSFIRRQDSTMWDIVWVSPQGHRSVSVSRHFFLQAPQCPYSVRKRSQWEMLTGKAASSCCARCDCRSDERTDRFGLWLCETHTLSLCVYVIHLFVSNVVHRLYWSITAALFVRLHASVTLYVWLPNASSI